jgi:hypothetical protein
MTFARYKAALEAIASGADDPVAVAKEALRSRIPPKKPKIIDPNKKTIEQIRQEQERARLDIFERWLAEGKPSHAELARLLGVSWMRVRGALNRTARTLRRDKEHPLWQEAENYYRGDWKNK